MRRGDLIQLRLARGGGHVPGVAASQSPRPENVGRKASASIRWLMVQRTVHELLVGALVVSNAEGRWPAFRLDVKAGPFIFEDGECNDC